MLAKTTLTSEHTLEINLAFALSLAAIHLLIFLAQVVYTYNSTSGLALPFTGAGDEVGSILASLLLNILYPR